MSDEYFNGPMRVGDRAQSSGWQPIETAPKDGTQIWLWWDGKRRLAHWHEAVNPPSIGGRFANWLTDDKGSVSVTVKPTLWQPLPAPPVLPSTARRRQDEEKALESCGSTEVPGSDTEAL